MNQIKKKLIRYKNKEKKVVWFLINWLFDFDFGKKPQKSCIFILFFPIAPLLLVILTTLISYNLLSITFGPWAPVLSNTPIYSMYTLVIVPILGVYI